MRVEGLQIINGGQTSKTVQATLAEPRRAAAPAASLDSDLGGAFVLVRLYQVARDSAAFVQTITLATNSQNPVDLRDLRSNDARQKTARNGDGKPRLLVPPPAVGCESASRRHFDRYGGRSRSFGLARASPAGQVP